MRQTAGDELVEIFSELGLSCSAKQRQSLSHFLDLLERWNGAYNLTAIRRREQMLTHHLADCLSIISPLQKHLAGRQGRVLDVGSGGGLPGVVIAVMTDLDVTCVDAVGKKAAFIRQVAASLNLLNLHGVHARVESLVTPDFDVIVSRAFAALGKFVDLTRSSLRLDGAWLAMKAALPGDEMAALSREIEVFHVEQLRAPGVAASRCLVWMRARRELPMPEAGAAGALIG